jgi:hypothetical protein
MQTENLKLTPEMLLWKEAKVAECEMEFSAGGDSMNDYEFNFYDSKAKKISNKKTEELKNFFEDEVFKRVEFYVNSDGYYMGEAGKVIITFNDDEDEPDFDYHKDAQAEFSETFTDTFEVVLSKEEKEVLQSKIGSMNGGDGEKNVNYKIDCVINNDEANIIDKLLKKFEYEADTHTFTNEDTNGEASEWFNWTTNLENSETDMEFTKKGITIQVSRSFTIYRPSED